MIFYFSGTGNSLYIAKRIAEDSKEDVISIAAAINSDSQVYEYTLRDNETIGFVFPIYAWAPPKMVLQFIERLKLNNYKNNYIFSVATCGENIGNTMKLLNDHLEKKSLILNSGFSIKMPNNYIIMGNVDAKEKENKKLSAAEDTLNSIYTIIKERKSGVFEVNKGPIPAFLTTVINPLFNRNALDTKKFYANDKCSGCGICERICNCQSIKVQGKPTWGDKCSQCLACIHLCPTKAIQYGKGTETKGRYRNPNVRTEEMKIKSI